MKLTLYSFGFKHGYPDANIAWDVRFLPNPYWEEHLREHTGLKEQIAHYVLDNATGQEFLKQLAPLLILTLNSHKTGGREELRCAIGCTGGRHRSVAVVEHLRGVLTDILGREDELTVYHRDIEKK